MTSKDIALKYLKSINLKLDRGDYTAVLMPYIMMDLQYQIYCDKIKDYKFRHDAKNWKKYWIKAYNEWNESFFALYEPDEKVFITDLMDGLHDAIHNDLVKIKCAVNNLLSFCEIKDKNLKSDLLVCNLIAQVAHIFWECSHKNRFNVVPVSTHIQNVEHWTYELANKWHPLDRDVSMRNDKEIGKLVDAMVGRIVDFVKSRENGN